MHHPSVSREITILYFFSWNFIWFGQKEPIKVQNFKLTTAHEISPNLYFDRLLLLKSYKISAKKIQRSYVSWQWRAMQNLKKTNLLFQKWQEFGEFWSEHSKVSKICTLIGPFCAKYVTFDLNKYRGVIFHDTEEVCKIWRKTDLWFRKWHEEFGKFSAEHLKVSKLGLWWDPFVQNRKCLS